MRSIARFLAISMLLLSSCATYREHLNRAHRLYDENEYERALAIFRSIEPDMDSLTLNDQARYAYLRGMTDYRLGFRPDSRHWLAVAKATEQEHPGGLSGDWKGRLEEALNDLNREVYGGAEAVQQEGAPAASGQPAAPPAPAESAPPAAPAP